MLSGDADIEHASEEELIQLAIAASLSEIPGECSPPRGLDCPAGEWSATSIPAHRSPSPAPGAPEDGAGRNWTCAGGAWGSGTPKAWKSVASQHSGAWGSPSPSSRPPQEQKDDADSAGQVSCEGDDAGNADESGGTKDGEAQEQSGPDVLQYAKFMGTGHGKCANEDEAILGVPLSEISSDRVVRFRVPLIGNTASVSGSADLLRRHADGEQGHDGGAEGEAPSEAQETCGTGSIGTEGRGVVHGYDAMSLARWLLRDQRLPLTSHRVSDEDVGRVWEVFMVSAGEDDLRELEGSGELVRDAVTGELRRADAQGKSMRLVDADDAGLDCLDWQFFLAEIHRLTYQVKVARNLLQRDRSFGKRGDGQMRMQLLAEMEGER